AAPVWVRLSDGRWWRPTDMAGHSNPGVMTLRDALIRSRNTVTTRVMQQVGLPSIVGLARGLGVKHSPLAVVPSLALGTSPVTLFEMVSAYSSIARQGVYKQPMLIRRIVDRNGQEVVRFGAPPPTQAMSRDAAVDLIDIMRGVVTQGTGYAIRGRFGITADVAGKTGTTQNNTDGWFILMHPQLVVGAWVGFNDARVTLRSSYWGQGGHNAIMLVGDFFSQALGREWVDVSARFPRAVHAAPAPPPPPAFDDPPAAPIATDVPIQTNNGGGHIVPLDMAPLQPAEVPTSATPTAAVSHLLDRSDLSAGRPVEALP
ncbi:penicillin-binding transpeptidase domain-containing protein, partial [Uliginosibacterium sp. sgz301328]|uniref:penicillin-binding transpeptidase domain-containing protein n=1 Tax=Uliginosibacterium sp. sgz301328 TaxID=3243764 RepID=UPI00359DABE5